MPDEDPPIWQFIPLTEYKSPSGPKTETMRNRAQAMFRRLRRSDGADPMDAVSERESELTSIPDFLIEQAAPEPDWRAPHVEALNRTYQSWLKAEAAEAGMHLLINAPHSQLPESVRKWAIDNECHVIEPPAARQILDNDPSWRAQMTAAKGKHWVLPALERCFLRRENGLDLLRSWLDWTREQPAGLVICDSWAWTFLSNTLQLDQILPPAQTLEPFDAAALRCWFRYLANLGNGREYTFRQADSGKLIYVSGSSTQNGNSEPASRDDPSTQDAQEESDYLKHLAARSRGVPEIAWRIWKQSLLVESDDEVEDAAEEKADTDHGRTIWVRPWDQLQLPATPGNFGLNEAFVLQALLLHDGLPDSLLPHLVPLMPFAVAGSIKQLQKANFITDDMSCRRVTSLGYVAVRGFLHDEGFLTDDL